MAKKTGRPARGDKIAAKKQRLSDGARCLRLHAAGWSIRRLADHFKIAPATVGSYIDEALRAIPEPAVANYRKVMSGHLDDLIRAHRKTMADPESAKVVVAAVNSYMKLYGLSAPIKVEDVTPPDAARSGLASQFARLARALAEEDEEAPGEPEAGGV